MSNTINKTQRWIIRFSIAAPTGEEITKAMVVDPVMTRTFNGEDLITYESRAVVNDVLPGMCRVELNLVKGEGHE